MSLGGGGGGSQQTGQQTTVTELPSWARPYAQNILAKGEALTDINKNPYQTYGAPRQAGFSPMEEQAFAGAANLAPSQAGLAGQDVALGASLGALNTGQFGVPQAQQYMNPYLESALAPQMELMRRQQGAQAQQMAGQATQAGAFGGSRYGLAQAQQNLANQLAQQNLVGQGYNTAYQQAMQQYNADQARRLQGLSTALQGAGQLGQLGAQQFGQQQAAIGMQGQMGAQQRAMEQQGLDIAYQDFLNQQNYPYRQLGFMSDLLRGTPTGSSASMNMYQPQPGFAQTAGSLGLGAYGLSKLFGGSFADGGKVKTYAGDRESVTSEDFEEDKLSSMGYDQLMTVKRNALMRGDKELAELVDKVFAANRSIQAGLGNAFNQLPSSQQQNVINAAGGGILAFAKGGTKQDFIAQSLESPPEVSPEESLQNVSARARGISSLYGEDTVAPFAKELAEERAQYRGRGLSDMDQGLIALQMAGALIDPTAGSSFARGAGLAASRAGTTAASILAQNKQANRELLRSQVELANSQQARKEGRINLAANLEDKAETRRANAFEQKRDAASKAADIMSREDVARFSAAVHNRPGEMERQIADYEARLGRKLDPEEYLKAMGDIGAARYGVRYTGQNKDIERYTNILKSDDEYKMLKLQRSQLAGQAEPNDKQRAKLAQIDNRIAAIEARARSSAGMGQGAGPAQGAPQVPPQAIAALRADPRLRDQFDAKYGRGSADRYLGD